MPKLRDFSPPRITLLRVGIFLGLIVVFFGALRIPVFSQVFSWFEAGLTRLGTGFGNGLNRVTESEESLAAKYQACEEDRMTLAVEQASRLQLEKELADLRELLGYQTSTGAEGVITQVLARSVIDDDTLVLVDKGELDGIQPGSAVVISSGVIYGLVSEVRPTTSLVRLVSNPGSQIPAAILGQTRTIGLVTGQEGALLTMDFIPQDAALKTGDLVVTSGLDGQVAEGLVIGLVTEVVSAQSTPFQQAYIELLYEPREWVSALILPPPGL